MKNENSFENLNSLLRETENNEDVLTFFNRWRKNAATSDVRTIRKAIAAKFSISENYVFTFCSYPNILYPKAREKYLPVMQDLMKKHFEDKANEALRMHKIYAEIVARCGKLVY